MSLSPFTLSLCLRRPPSPPTAPKSMSRRSPLLLLSSLSLSVTSLLLSSLSVTSLLSRFRLLNSKLSHLHSILAAAAAAASADHHHPLLLHLLPSLLSTLQTLASLSSRYSETTTALLRSKLLLQIDLDIASNSLSLHIRDLEILLSFGLLRRSADDSSSAIVLPLP